MGNPASAALYFFSAYNIHTYSRYPNPNTRQDMNDIEPLVFGFISPSFVFFFLILISLSFLPKPSQAPLAPQDPWLASLVLYPRHWKKAKQALLPERMRAKGYTYDNVATPLSPWQLTAKRAQTPRRALVVPDRPVPAGKCHSAAV